MLTIKQAAAKSGMSVQGVRYHLDAGNLTANRSPIDRRRTILIDEDELNVIINDRAVNRAGMPAEQLEELYATARRVPSMRREIAWLMLAVRDLGGDPWEYMDPGRWTAEDVEAAAVEYDGDPDDDDA